MDPATSSMPSLSEVDRYRRPLVSAMFCGLISLCLWQMYAYQRVESYNTDSTHYIVLAQNLTEGEGYWFNSKPQTRYPPGLPALLAAASLVTGGGYVPFIFLMPLFGTLGLMVSFLLLEREEDWTIAAIACLLLAASPHYFRFATQYIWSDLPYFFASMTALLFAIRLRTGSAREAFVATVGLSASIFAAVMIRSVAISLVAALLATIVFSWRTLGGRAIRAYALAAAVGAASQMSWMSWARARVVPDYPGEYMHSYTAQLMMKDPLEPALGQATLADFVIRIAEFGATQMIRFTQLLAPVPWIDRVWFSPFVLVPAGLLLAGVVHSILRGRSTLLAWYVLAYLGLYALWPFDEGTRFATPVFPLLVLFAWRGVLLVAAAAGGRPERLARIVPAVGAVAVAATLSYLGMWNPGRQVLASVVFWWGLFVVSFATSSPIAGPALARAGRYARAAGIAAFLLSAGAGVVSQTRVAAANLNPNARRSAHAGVVGAADWLRAHASGSVVMAQQASILHRLTGQRTVTFPVTSDAGLVTDVMRRYDVSYLVVAPDRYEYYTPPERARLEALLRDRPDCCQMVASGEGFEIYRVRRNESPPGIHPNPMLRFFSSFPRSGKSSAMCA